MYRQAADRIHWSRSDSQWRRARHRFPILMIRERQHRIATTPGGPAPNRRPGHWHLKGSGRLRRRRLNASPSPSRMVAAKTIAAARIANWRCRNPCPMMLRPQATHRCGVRPSSSCRRHRLDCLTHPSRRPAMPTRGTNPRPVRRRPRMRVHLIHPAIFRHSRAPDQVATCRLVAARERRALRLPVRARPLRLADLPSPQVGSGRPRQDVHRPLA